MIVALEQAQTKNTSCPYRSEVNDKCTERPTNTLIIRMKKIQINRGKEVFCKILISGKINLVILLPYSLTGSGTT